MLLEIEVSVYSLIDISKLSVRCMDNVIMFYEKKFGKCYTYIIAYFYKTLLVMSSS